MTRKRKKTSNQYFAEREEKAVFDYITTDSASEKNRLYNDILAEPFRKMTESILRRYPNFIGNYDIHEVEANALSHLVEHMVKYKPFVIEYKPRNGNIPWKKSKVHKFLYIEDAIKKQNELSEDYENEYKVTSAKAFSYCQTIVRNFYKDHSKRSSKEKNQQLSFDDYSSKIMENSDYIYEIDNNTDHMVELLNIIIDSITERLDNDTSLKKNEIIAGEAIVQILTNWEILFMEETPEGKVQNKVTSKYQKNKILNYVREITLMSMKEVRAASKPFKELYYFEKDKYFNED